ncbi:hypothetical protein SNE35_06905 [Paucibacter sp. R3-3]|uniref:ABC transporter permease n=1 Tax=Roseateles agri TaxID=3098619 RepID=A0ABU5DD71_9BURK|nr:hypothetical protein [Paucibacter sp. R3-3]MDY0744227.1 hypothetical protein [Paucibacter sp. R3-3]
MNARLRLVPEFPPLFFSPSWPIWLLLLGLNGFVALAIAGFRVFMTQQPVSDEAQLLLCMLPGGLLAAAAASGGNSLARALAVVQARVSPQRGVAGVRQGLLNALLAAWVFSTLPLVLLAGANVYGSGDFSSLAAAAAALALALALGLLGGTLWWGPLTRIGLLLPVLLVLAIDTDPLLRPWSRWMHAWPLHLLLLVGLPCLLPHLLPRSVATGRRAPSELFERWMKRSATGFQGINYRTMWRAWGMLYASGIIFWTSNSLVGTPLLADWGIELDWRWGLRLLVLCVMTGSLLRCPGLEWRRLLAPGGMTRERLGLHVLRHTLWGIGRVLLLLVPLVLLSQGLISHRGWAAVITEAPGQWLPLLAELALATSLAVIARGFAGEDTGSIAVAGLAALVGVLLLGALCWQRPAVDAMIHWPRGFAHIAACLLAGAALLPLVRRAWSRTNLARLSLQINGAKREPEDA